MRFAVHVNQLGRIDMGVALRGAQLGVSQQLLDGAQVGSALQQMRGKRVAQRVRADAHPGAALGHVATKQPVDAAIGQPRAAVVDEQRI